MVYLANRKLPPGPAQSCRLRASLSHLAPRAIRFCAHRTLGLRSRVLRLPRIRHTFRISGASHPQVSQVKKRNEDSMSKA